jgi:hypothetical protein
MTYNITKDDIAFCDAMCYKHHGYFETIPDEDQIQDCREYMCRAAEKYEPEEGKFKTYASWWIIGAVKKHYTRKYNGYPKSSDVYYQGLQADVSSEHHINLRDLENEYGKKDLVNRLVETMPRDVKIGLTRYAEGERYSDIIKDIGYKLTQQNFNAKIQRWRKNHGIIQGERHIA